MDEEKRLNQENPGVDLVREEEKRDEHGDETRDVTEKHGGSAVEVDLASRVLFRAPEFGILHMLPYQFSDCDDQN